MDLEKALSPRQYQAAVSVETPLCILAGAGTGKTRVITHRIAHLIDNLGAHPASILAVTFTNKAAREMRERVNHLLPGRSRGLQLGTFHGIAARMLRTYGDVLGLPGAFVIYDQDDATRLIQRIAVKEMGLSRDRVRGIAHLIDGWQNQGLLPEQVPAPEWDPFFEKAHAVYTRYRAQLAEMGAVDFGGLLLGWRALLQHEAVGPALCRRVRHLLVDEYQDTSPVQADVVLAMGRQADTVAVVGDDDQSIYSWRGASADNLRHFIDRLPQTRLIKLEENYRSTARILSAANQVIAQNVVRLGKELSSISEEGTPVRVIRYLDDIAEAKGVVGWIEERSARGQALSDVAILVRTNAQSRLFEEQLRRSRLPYRLVGGQRFYDRKEVKDVLATLRAGLNPKSDVDLLRALAAVPRGVGAKSVEKIDALAKAEKKPLLVVMADPGLVARAGLSKRAQNGAAVFAKSILELGELSRRQEGAEVLSAHDAVALAVERSGVAERLAAEGSFESEGRLENLNQLLSAAAQYVDDAKAQGENPDAQGFLEAASLMSDADGTGQVQADDDAVTLMTMHAAKGLEFPVVFLVGLEESGFPHGRALAEDADPSELEEERRLAYVGMTRAQRELRLTWAARRMVRGEHKRRQPSRFLRELPEGEIHGDVPGAMGRRAQRRPSLLPVEVGEPDPPRANSDEMRVELDPAYAAPVQSAQDLASGARVVHQTFGLGRVVGLRGGGRMLRALVRFDNDRQPRMILARHLGMLSQKAAAD
jgi:DNA helicase-2/ATP-dependent DNA helicase PcrA